MAQSVAVSLNLGLYNCVMIGFESGWLTESAPHALSPIGAVQRGAVEFVARHGQPEHRRS